MGNETTKGIYDALGVLRELKSQELAPENSLYTCLRHIRARGLPWSLSDK
jgi:hypothetical protein